MGRTESVLILGGSGQAGAGTAALLREWHPDLPLTIAGRDLGRAQRVADEVGNATAVTVDLERTDLGLPEGSEHSAVVAALWDSRLHGLGYAQDRGLPYLSLSSGLVDIAPEVVLGAQRAGAAPMLLASHWCAGVITVAALELAREFERVDAVRVGAMLDESDTGGPAGIADLERWGEVTSAGLVRRDGAFRWIDGPDADVDLVLSDGRTLPARSIAVLDVPGVALATGARDVGFAFAVGESAGRRRGGGPSVEARIDLEGVGPGGEPLRTSHYLVHAEGQRPLTALGIALGVERLIGLRGEAVVPGIHTPEGLIDPAYAAKRLAEIGAVFVEAEPVTG
ncbi:saccharopine dehydrogenase [Streptomyces sp. NPDC088387]|uniref:saccharopine dehydrogenase n=1 Tax=Streptomyces sp. NPDC088387 TaxID=3365859 RepID=UPI00380D1E65